MSTITFEEIEKRYKKILLSKKIGTEKYEEINLLIKELQESFLIPIMKSETNYDFRRTKEFRMYIKLSNLRTENLEGIEDILIKNS